MELADTSAWTSRHKDAAVDVDFDERVLTGAIAICSPVAMELLWTARSGREFHELREELDALPNVEVGAEVWRRAIDVWEALAARGRIRQVKWIDFVIAAAAEVAGVGLCHYDRDFEVIAAVTGQSQRALAPVGTL